MRRLYYLDSYGRVHRDRGLAIAASVGEDPGVQSLADRPGG
jgi:hypothetical protein